MNESSNISDTTPGSIAPTFPSQIFTDEPEIGESGTSTIERSKSVVVAFTPVANFPILAAPGASDGRDAFIVLSMSANKGGAVETFLMSQQLRLDSITNDMLDGWLKNIREIQEQVQQLLRSPEYQQLMLIRIQGDPSLGLVSGVQSPLAANAAANHPSATTVEQTISLNQFVRGLETFERVSASASASESEASANTAKTVIPMIAGLIAGGALGLGVLEISSNATGVASTVMGEVVGLVSHLQPILPQLAINILPSINLLIMPLIYFTSWDASVGNLRNKGQESLLETAKQFARDVLKTAGNSQFVLDNVINKIPGADQLTDAQKSQLVAIYGLVVAGTALSLLYSVEVGKAMGEQFLGMEPQEFQGLLMGTIPVEAKKGAPPEEQLKLDLLKMIKGSLSALPKEERVKVIESLFEYLSGSRKVNHFFDAKKSFEEVLSNCAINPQPICAA